MAYKPRYVDSCWSLVVGISSFLAQAILGGYVFTAGIFYTIFLEEFPDTNEVVIAWLCNLPLTLWFLSGPLGSVLTNKFGCRLCAVIGGLCSSVALSLCFLTTNFYLIFLLYGVAAGIGNGVHYVAFITVINQYFMRYRLIANLMASTGITVGMATYAVVVPYLTEIFGWRSCLLIIGGISFNLCALGCSLYPTEPIHSSKRALELWLLKDRYFMLFVIHCVFCNLSSSIIFLHLPALILSFGFGVKVASLSLTTYGLANCFGKVCHSFLSYVRKQDACVTYTFSLCICGTVMILLPIMQNTIWIPFMAALLGSTYCVTGGYTPEVTMKLVGLENISDGLGFGQVGKAIGSTVAGPLAGLLYQWSSNYRISFYVGGSVMIFSCLLMIPVTISLRRRRSQQKTDLYTEVALKVDT